MLSRPSLSFTVYFRNFFKLKKCKSSLSYLLNIHEIGSFTTSQQIKHGLLIARSFMCNGVEKIFLKTDWVLQFKKSEFIFEGGLSLPWQSSAQLELIMWMFVSGISQDQDGNNILSFSSIPKLLFWFLWFSILVFELASQWAFSGAFSSYEWTPQFRSLMMFLCFFIVFPFASLFRRLFILSH